MKRSAFFDSNFFLHSHESHTLHTKYTWPTNQHENIDVAGAMRLGLYNTGLHRLHHATAHYKDILPGSRFHTQSYHLDWVTEWWLIQNATYEGTVLGRSNILESCLIKKDRNKNTKDGLGWVRKVKPYSNKTYGQHEANFN